MRIAHILPYDLAQPGGVQTHTLALSDALTALGHDCDVFAPARPLRVAVGGTRADLTLHPRDLLELRSFLRQPHDILHIQEPILPLAGPLSLLHPDPRPIVVTLHSAEAAAGRLYRWSSPLTRRLLRRADAIVCASDAARRNAASVLPPDAAVIFPCVDLAPFRGIDARRTEHPDASSNTILFVGRDEPRKGLRVLLAAMRQLPQAQLIVAGPVSDQTRSAAPGNVKFLGPLPHSKVPELMVAAGCAAFPALGGEALGLVLIEAMAAGLPVAASDIAGYRIASQDGRASLLSEPGDPAALAEHLRQLLSDPDLRAAITANGRSSADRFDAQGVALQHLELYRSLRPK